MYKGSDIHLFDWLVGQINDKIDADLIISADHGHLKGEKGLIVYGFELYEGAVHIPLITPNYFGKKTIDFPVGGVFSINLINEFSKFLKFL